MSIWCGARLKVGRILVVVRPNDLRGPTSTSLYYGNSQSRHVFCDLVEALAKLMSRCGDGAVPAARRWSGDRFKNKLFVCESTMRQITPDDLDSFSAAYLRGVGDVAPAVKITLQYRLS